MSDVDVSSQNTEARGETDELCIVQARPETVHSRKDLEALKTYALKATGDRLLTGLSIGNAIAAGKVCLLKSPEQIEQFADGAILVTEMTDPDWVPIMKRARGILTDYGGRTSHAAIVSRELGIPAVVGTGEATEVLRHGQAITLSCAEGDEGHVYEGILDFEASEVQLADVPSTQTRMIMNMASPAAAFLVEAGIDSISLNPNSVLHVKRHVATVEAKRA